MRNKIFFIALALILLFIVVISGVKANTTEEFLLGIALTTFLAALIFAGAIGFNLAVDIVLKFDSDVRTIVATSSIVIGAVIVVGELTYKGIPIFPALVIVLAFMGVINVLAILCKTIYTTIMLKRRY